MKQLLLFVGLLAGAATVQAQPKIGVVSYSFRHAFERNIDSTLDAVKAMGITDIEFSNLFGQTAAALKAKLDSRGMTCSSYGVGYADLVNKTDEVGLTARVLGDQFVRVAWIPQDSTGFTEQVLRKAADDFNRAGKLLQEKYQLRFCYHNHGYEFTARENGTSFDLLVSLTDPRYVGFEMDILWVFFPGQDPVALLHKYPKRFFLMHLKDLKKGVAGNTTGGTPGNNNVPLGQGQLDIPAILKAARKTNVQHFYIEDESDRSFQQVPQSLEFVKGMK